MLRVVQQTMEVQGVQRSPYSRTVGLTTRGYLKVWGMPENSEGRDDGLRCLTI